ncbi:hypothetical protein IV203_000978 [Nitzschia inconspicua]|uniref:Uncharacterized protein n=1 Tax=Nitzschia inconspicua TaxID=303405 RepID=A0A9K3PQR6_9STRA|nr:hypothetical protein IV203_000978 [Nitzschia inconspicua]
MNLSPSDSPTHHGEEIEEDEMPPFALTDLQPSLSLTNLFSTNTTGNRTVDTDVRIWQSSHKSKVEPTSFNDIDSSTCFSKPKAFEATFSDSQNSTNTPPPGLVESMMTDGSSSIQSGSDTGSAELRLKSPQHHHQPQQQQQQQQQKSSPSSAHRMAASSTFLMSSLHTVHSDAATSTLLSPNQLLLQSNHPSIHQFNARSSSASDTTPRQSNTLLQQSDSTSASVASVGFSQLLQAADNNDMQLRLSTTATKSRMASVPEDEEKVQGHFDQTKTTTTSCSQVSGALIVDPTPESPSIALRSNIHRWMLPSLSTWGGGQPENRALQTPLLAASSTPVTRLLSNNASGNHANTPLERARDTVKAVVEDDQSFQVSIQLQDNVSVDNVMWILANPELLRLWCDPIETLIVTSSSTEGRSCNEPTPPTTSNDSVPNDRAREYEGEWIEATTTALGSPPSSVGFLFSAGQTVLETLGFATYGRITMFVERRRGHVGLTIGPFHGGIHASHTITVSTDINGRVNVLDRVRLTRNEEEMSLSGFFGCFDSCLSRCVLPSTVGYLNQVMTSMARLRLLLENSDIASGATSIMVVNAPRW